MHFKDTWFILSLKNEVLRNENINKTVNIQISIIISILKIITNKSSKKVNGKKTSFFN